MNDFNGLVCIPLGPRCPECHPFANPLPLTIDGAAYRRRMKGRKR